MPAVKDLFPLFKALAGNRAASADPDTMTALLNAAKTELHKLYVGWESDDNYFVQRSQYETDSADDYFAPITSAAREYNLPTDFYGLRSIEIVTPNATGIIFRKHKLADHEFRIRRMASSSSSKSYGDILYDLVGQGPGQMVLADWPSGTINARLWYVKTPTEWTSPAASTAEFPASSHVLIADWAAHRLMLGLGDARWQGYVDNWNKEVDRWGANLNRNTAEREYVRGFGE